ncbi:MAG: Rrf2 family transcriptional regulator [Gemmatimonadetes bacterium]|jgi:Rrf2 family transcriptional regulator, cysteine metabolism repressor|nr:Rrf2 family transcriptional regulator [Gemmatimonadota bacterium]
MKLSTRARYALRMMVEIAKKTNGGEKVSLSQVAKSSDLPRRYLEQLAIDLKKASLITGISGKGGGYILTKSPEKIRIGQIVEATIGPVNIVDCVLVPETCIKVDYCDCRLIYKRINERITEVLNDFSLADLAAGNVPNEELSPVTQGSG